MSWQMVIGLEIHAQLDAESKIFSPANIAYCEDPNTQVHEVDFGLPGALPVINKKVVESAVRFGLAVNATVNRRSEFARKNYFYPDLPKGYQISQFEFPIVTDGELFITTGKGDDATTKRIGITRAHLEEDAGKLVHDKWANYSGVDLNRAGTPLLEIVSEPDMHTIEEAVAYATAMRQLVRWLAICDGNMQEGSFRIDANISVNRPGEPMGTRCEIKNLNSFKFLEQALNYERQRQIDLIEGGGQVEQQTRLFDVNKGVTRAMRGKEDAHDYRYFPDPDLPPLVLEEAWVAAIAESMPLLPQQCNEWLRNEFQLSDYDADLLTTDKALFEYFKGVIATFTAATPDTAKLVANWLCGDFLALLNGNKIGVEQSPISIANMAELMACLQAGDISGKIAKDVLVKMWESGDGAKAIIESQGLQQISDEVAIEKVVQQIISDNPQQVQAYRGGKDKLFGFFVGQTMKATGGRANPEIANRLIKKLLNG